MQPTPESADPPFRVSRWNLSWLLAAIFGAVGVVVGAVGVVLLVLSPFDMYSNTVTGTVTAGKGIGPGIVTVQYTVDHHPYATIKQTTALYSDGDRVTVSYRSGHPADAVLGTRTGSKVGSIILVVIGAVFCVLAGLLTYLAVKQGRRVRRVLSSGSVVNATVTGVEEVTSTTRNNTPARILRCSWIDDHGQTRLAASGPFFPRKNVDLATVTTVRVAVLPGSEDDSIVETKPLT